jgi:hypothetical protein
MKRFWTALMATLLVLQLSAHEGMWLPQLIKALNHQDMTEHGLQLTADELYNANGSSLKDAIVSLGGFCTAEVISDQGLMLTNHHCGYDAIRSHSSEENDYLKNGFWAMSKAEELPNEGLTATFLVQVEDVTDRVNAVLNDEMSEDERSKAIRSIGQEIAQEAKGDSHYDTFVRSFFHGNEFYLFTMETFKDVRLVGAPPESVGKYGGDTDNWMWPRHTGDFSMFRIYSGPDGKPAEYSADNIPMAPRHFLPISLDGVQEDDFSMVFGFPGSTDRYLSSHGVQQAIDKYNPSVVKVRDLKLEIMRKYMESDRSVDLLYASKYASTANYWKYYIGQTKQLKNNNVYGKKKALEDEFQRWADLSTEHSATYGRVIGMLAEGYEATDKYVVSGVYTREALLRGSSHILFAYGASSRFAALEKAKQAIKDASSDEEKADAQSKYDALLAKTQAALTAGAEQFFAENHDPLERELMERLFQLYADDIAPDQQPAFISENKGEMDKLVKKLWKKSIYTDKERFMAAIEDPNFKKIKKDPLGRIGMEAVELYRSGRTNTSEAQNKLEKAYRLLTAGIREMQPDKKFSPDANSTLRMTWGVVGSYEPRDGVHYNYQTTLDGVMQKKDESGNELSEFYVMPRLEELWRAKDYGEYADENGELVVCFISNNDITGGNSGSPVINGYGELIGTAFDGNWEAMSGDIFFEDKLQRTISVDIRYTLFIIDKYAGAGHLVDEMKLVRRGKEEEKVAP